MSHTLWGLVATFLATNLVLAFGLLVAPVLFGMGAIEITHGDFRFGYGSAGWVIQDRASPYKMHARGWWPWHRRSS